jgi:hypothetical protein
MMIRGKSAQTMPLNPQIEPRVHEDKLIVEISLMLFQVRVCIAVTISSPGIM